MHKRLKWLKMTRIFIIKTAYYLYLFGDGIRKFTSGFEGFKQ